MSQIVYRANLNAQAFPFVSEFQGQSIIVKWQDQNYVQTATIQQSNDLDKDVGIPQIYYCHNVMPSAQGLQSIGYNTLIPAFSALADFTDMYLLRDASENKAYLCHGKSGDNYILLAGTTSWFKINTIAGTANSIVTVAFVSGETYIYFSGVGCYKYVFATSTLVAVTLSGLNAATILGITSAAGYLIAWSATAIAWSSTIDPTDFVPSNTTGAGGGAVEAARGQITTCLPQTLGFIVYTTDNAVASLYSGNALFPFNFREIVSSGGLSSASLVSYDGNTSNHYAYTTEGLELISMQVANTVFPELTDFISGNYFEDFDEVTNTFSNSHPTTILAKKITTIASRYLVFSYGLTSLTHAIVFDLAYKRFGKLKIPHVDCFEYKLLTTTTTETPRQSIAFLQADGTIKQVDFSFVSTVSSGCLILGKYQFARSRLLQLDGITCENVKPGNVFSLTVLSSLDGKSYDTVTSAIPLDLDPEDEVRSFGIRVTGVNHSLLFKGNFYLVSLLLTFNISGRR